jgi:hypothetical protein
VKMDFERTVLAECTFRAAAFWRLLYQVWQLTEKNCPDALPIGSLKDRDWNEKVPDHVRTLVAMLFEMNAGVSARSEFLTYDEDILANAVMMVVQAFSLMPELMPKLETLYILTSAGSALFGPDVLNQRSKARTEEMINLAKEFHKMSKAIKGKFVTTTGKIKHGQLPDQNIYFTFTVLE